jgi:hypothetical protein
MAQKHETPQRKYMFLEFRLECHSMNKVDVFYV